MKRISIILILMLVSAAAHAFEVNYEGLAAKVNSENQLYTKSTEQSRALFHSMKGKAFSWTTATLDIDANDTALAVRNDSTTEKLVITKISIQSSIETVVILHFPQVAYTPTGTAVTGVCLNDSSTNIALATAKADETANTQGSIFRRLETQANIPVEISTDGIIVLGYQDSIAIDLVADCADVHATIEGYFDENK